MSDWPNGVTVTLLDGPCDRCGKRAEELHAYHWSEVVYRGRKIEYPWLCPKCYGREKEKAFWKGLRPKGEP